MSMKSKIAAAVAIGSLFLVTNEASAYHEANGHVSAQHRVGSQIAVRHLPGVFERTYGYVPPPMPRYGSRSDVYSSNSLGRQPFPNPDRDYSIENLSSHGI